MFNDHGLYTWTEEFQSNQLEKFGLGVNIIGQLPGRYTGTRDDKIVLIGAHYDTVQGSPGVDDNGSGMTALLQALKLHTNPDKLNCSACVSHFICRVLILEENQQTTHRCENVLHHCWGSALSRITLWAVMVSSELHACTSYSTGASFVQGAFMIQTRVLNYNNTAKLSKLPDQKLLMRIFQRFLRV
ncbi:hypothetical protein OS493_040091 [Desmophyllum pertusum]|uniref:Peptidase M28 domain-containing protein n=1 Tax=Desmophyllum pertusum TaxID=174260 RepID=A0A9W9Z610_9CNID|nr:hypothetical protein OS493_040091 [Desmophyllum pertusum]